MAQAPRPTARAPREYVERAEDRGGLHPHARDPGRLHHVELIAPRKGGNPGLDKFLRVAQRGARACTTSRLSVDDLAGALRELDARGVPLIDKVPRPGARGHQVGFLHPKAADGDP